MIELTESQVGALDNTDWPPVLLNPKTGEAYVLLPREMFDRVRTILEAEDGIEDVEGMLPLAAEVMNENVSLESA